MKNMKRKDYSERIDHLLSILKDGQQKSIDELAQFFNVSPRTIYRMISQIEQQGYIVDSGRGHPQLLRNNNDQDPKVYFSHQETQQLQHLVSMLSYDNPYRRDLSSDLMQKLRNTLMPYLENDVQHLLWVSRISEAMRSHHQIIIRKYQSGNSNSICDRHVEPTQWSPNYRQIYAYDIDKQGMRTFVLNRIGGIDYLDTQWKYEHKHETLTTDCFWMTGTPRLIILQLRVPIMERHVKDDVFF